MTLHVTGEIDTLGLSVLQMGLDGLWSHAASRVIIDLTGVTFIGLPGLRLLLRARSTAEQRRARLSLRAGSTHLYRVLGMVGAGDITEDCSRRGSALGTPPQAAGPVGPSTTSDLGSVLRALRWSATHPVDGVTDALRSVAESAATYLPGGEGAGVLLVAGPGGLVSGAATDPVVKILDLVQQRSRRGPAWHSAWNGEDVLVDDLDADARWPEVAAEATGLGVRSLLCLHLGSDGDALGALTVYSSAPGAFGPAVSRLGHAFAAIATIALAVSRQSHAPSAGDVSRATGEPAGRPDTIAHPVHSPLVRTRPPRRRLGPDLVGRLPETGES